MRLIRDTTEETFLRSSETTDPYVNEAIDAMRL